MSKLQKIILIILAVVLVAAVLLLAGRDNDPVVGDFVPPAFDPAAQSGVPMVPEELGWSPMDMLHAHVCGVLNEEDGQVAVWLYNHPDSDCWLKLRMLDKNGNILGETGLLKPGEYVQYLTLTTTPAKDTTVILKLMGYEPETYYSGGSLGLETVLKVSD